MKSAFGSAIERQSFNPIEMHGNAMKLTLDWNCVIEVEENRPQARFVDGLIQGHRRGDFEVALLAASASENTKSKRFPGNAGLFLSRVSALGWQDLPLVKMPAVWGLSYWDFCYYVDDGDDYDRAMRAIWKVIAPKIPYDSTEHLPAGTKPTDEFIQSEALSKWRNTWCDVVSAYSHIQSSRDVFVTNNTRDFQKNAAELSLLGMKNICTPKDAFELTSVTSSSKE